MTTTFAVPPYILAATVQVRLVELTNAGVEQVTDPTLIVGVATKFAPVIVIFVVAPKVPVAGLTEETVGGGEAE